MTFALRGEPTDRPALAYLFLGGARHVLDAVGQSMRVVHGDPQLMASVQVTAAELFGHDSSMLPWGCLTVEAEAFGCGLEYHEHYYPQVNSRPLENSTDLSLLVDPDPHLSARMPLMLEGLTAMRGRAQDDSFITAMVVSPFLVAAELRGMATLLTDFISDPPYVEALMDHVTEGIGRYVSAILENGSCDAIMFENAGMTRDLMGPHHVVQFIVPYQQRLLALARQQDPNVILIEHNCSDTPYFDEILALDIDAVSFAHGDVRAISQDHGWDCQSAHTRANTCVDRFCVRPDQREQPIALIGNVDQTQIVLNGTPDEVFRESRASIESARGGPYCLSTGCEIPFKAPLENIQALARAARAGF